MHVARGGWLGQTYALAKFDDSSEGKKSGIRRSKEERKGMVESFIKRYQKLNNGDFPSLNLTRKEVGGSFYTVREIVREIIQENRVLGPPKSPSVDQNRENLDSFLEHYPLGWRSLDLHLNSEPPNDTQALHEYASPELETGNNKHLLCKETHLSDNSVNLLDIKSEVEIAHDNSVNVLDINSEEEIAHDNSANVLDIKSEEEIAHLLPESEPTLASRKAQNHSPTAENMVLDVNGNTNVKDEEILPAEEKSVNGANPQNLHIKGSHISVQQSTLDERSANLNDRPDNNSQTRRTNTTLNRINLESWKAASKKSNGRETHHIVTFIKAFITAFVKFWSD